MENARNGVGVHKRHAQWEHRAYGERGGPLQRGVRAHAGPILLPVRHVLPAVRHLRFAHRHHGEIGCADAFEKGTEKDRHCVKLHAGSRLPHNPLGLCESNVAPRRTEVVEKGQRLAGPARGRVGKQAGAAAVRVAKRALNKVDAVLAPKQAAGHPERGHAGRTALHRLLRGVVQLLLHAGILPARLHLSHLRRGCTAARRQQLQKGLPRRYVTFLLPVKLEQCLCERDAQLGGDRQDQPQCEHTATRVLWGEVEVGAKALEMKGKVHGRQPAFGRCHNI
mmetsp:Transcript_14215/g.36326  ORF Transcript_14215/g.36326 Transcript_14215/m.36326 type:complete len:280 (+) Transcript_14215:685-1524(+)